jgi:hypothetical protein
LVTVTASLCGLVKLTTWVVFSVPIIILIFTENFKDKKFVFNTELVFKSLITLAIPYLISYYWTAHAESVRNLNPMAAMVFKRDTFMEWNFGTLDTKVIILAASITIFAVIYLITKKNPYRKLIYICFGVFASGPVIFTNLYLVHDYYYYANFMFLIAVIFLMLFPLLESNTKKSGFWGSLLYFSAFVVFVGVYVAIYLPVQRTNNKSIIEFADKIKLKTNKNDILLIYGHDWNSMIPYYSERKAIMDRFDLNPDKLISLKIINKDNRNKVKAMIVTKDYMQSTDFIMSRVKFLGLDSLPAFIDSAYGAVYLKPVTEGSAYGR